MLPCGNYGAGDLSYDPTRPTGPMVCGADTVRLYIKHSGTVPDREPYQDCISHYRLLSSYERKLNKVSSSSESGRSRGEVLPFLDEGFPMIYE